MPENDFFLDQVACKKKRQLRNYFCDRKGNARDLCIHKQYDIVHAKDKQCEQKVRYCRLCRLLFPKNQTTVERVIADGTDDACRYVCCQYV